MTLLKMNDFLFLVQRLIIKRSTCNLLIATFSCCFNEIKEKQSIKRPSLLISQMSNKNIAENGLDMSSSGKSENVTGIDDAGQALDCDLEKCSKINSKQSDVFESKMRSLTHPDKSTLLDPNNPHFYYARKVMENADHLDVLPSASGFEPNSALKEEPSKSFKKRKLSKQQFFSNDKSGSINKLKNEVLSEQSSDLGSCSKNDLEKSRASNSKKLDLENKSFLSSNLLVHSKKSVSRMHKYTENNKHKRVFGLWQLYCYLITFWAPNWLLKWSGMKEKSRRLAWREKIALISLILYCGGLVAFLTFGFSRTVCHPGALRLKHDQIDNTYLVINGKGFDLKEYKHPEALNIGKDSQVLNPPTSAAGKDASFLFQNVNGNCKSLILPRENCTIPMDAEKNIAWYFPCKMKAIDGSTKPNFDQKSDAYEGYACHTSWLSRDVYYTFLASVDVYYNWEDLINTTRNLVVLDGNVLDFDILDWFERDHLTYPMEFDFLKNAKLQGYDISVILSNYGRDKIISHCLTEILKVGVIDSESVGCISSKVVLYLSLIFILSVIFVKFFIACYFKWVVSRKQGVCKLDRKKFNELSNKIEDWSNDLNDIGPLEQPKVACSVTENNLFNTPLNYNKIEKCGMTTMTTQAVLFERKKDDTNVRQTELPEEIDQQSFAWLEKKHKLSWTHPHVVSQPRADFMPFNFPLIHSICFVTCYSEDEQGLRTTFDSLSVTDYPSSHKLIICVCDGVIKGSGNDKTTPEIVLGMMCDFLVDPEVVKPYSYVAVAAGAKRHNKAKIYSGFYKYDETTIPLLKQQKVPMVCIVKCGTEFEKDAQKPGNRGKRDSQVILMSFLQKIIFDERMTELEYHLLKNIWCLTGLMSDFYETVLMVDADTKVYPDSLKHMVAEMCKDPSIMGLCGETKIANKSDSWVTAIQVFEYFISHHQSKAFESIFGSVTCLPGCFSMYRIKSPKGSNGYWIPILANPDIVERYSDNVTNTLHKKNLLLLGEDRYLSSLMLKTFPSRKQVFVPKAACKTLVPDTFSVLLSQRRRWINSTIHNLMELVLVNDLCGTFCLSMQCVIFIELMGSIILPLAITFTIYIIIYSIVSEPTPVLTLILLAIILGLPGVLIVITASRSSYLVWMLIYILALPIWNFVLPTYAFWKFDDFSWGETRLVDGENAVFGASDASVDPKLNKTTCENASGEQIKISKKIASSHDEIEGEFDYSGIVLRTWLDFAKRELPKQGSQ